MKISPKEFISVVSTIVKEEVALAKKNFLQEVSGEELVARAAKDMRVRDLDKMRQWVFDKWFSPAHQGKKWYDPSVTPANVFDALVKPNSPISPRGALQVWKTMPSIQKGFKQASDQDIDQALAAFEKEKTGGKYVTGAETLKNIAASLGDLTPTMINKIYSSGEEKLKALTGGVSPEEMDQEDWEQLSDLIDQKRLEAAKEFASALKAHVGDVKGFLNDLIKARTLTANELGQISDNEVGALNILSGKSSEEIVATLMADIEKDNNLFKTFQNAVSYKVFPAKRVGRPAKDQSSSSPSEN